MGYSAERATTVSAASPPTASTCLIGAISQGAQNHTVTIARVQLPPALSVDAVAWLVGQPEQHGQSERKQTLREHVQAVALIHGLL